MHEYVCVHENIHMYISVYNYSSEIILKIASSLIKDLENCTCKISHFF